MMNLKGKIRILKRRDGEREIEKVRKGTKAIKLRVEINEMENIFH